MNNKPIAGGYTDFRTICIIIGVILIVFGILFYITDYFEMLKYMSETGKEIAISIGDE